MRFAQQSFANMYTGHFCPAQTFSTYYRYLFGCNIVFVLLNHLLYHLAADGACLLGGKVAVVAVGKIYANLACGLHLKLIEGVLRVGHECLLRQLFSPNLFVLSILKSASAIRLLSPPIVLFALPLFLCLPIFIKKPRTAVLGFFIRILLL